MQNEIIAKLAWKLSGEYKDGHNIGCLADDLAHEMDVECWSDAATVIEESICQYLREKANELYTEGEKPAEGTYGKIDIMDNTVYFALTNAYNEWYSEKPDWWDEVAIDPELIATLEKETLTQEEFNYVNEHEQVVEVENCGNSGKYPDKTWYNVKLTNRKEYSIY